MVFYLIYNPTPQTTNNQKERKKEMGNAGLVGYALGYSIEKIVGRTKSPLGNTKRYRGRLLVFEIEVIKPQNYI